MPPTPPLTLPIALYQGRPNLYWALTQAQLQPEAPECTMAQATRLLDLVVPLLLAVPQVELTHAQRQHLGGATYAESPALAYRTGRALCRDQDTFPGAAPVGASLQLRAQRALTLRGVSALLTTLARRLDDLALLDLASATKDAERIHKAVEADAADPRSSACDRLPLATLGAARRLIRVRSGRPRRAPAV